MFVCAFRVKLESVEAERQLCVNNVEREKIRVQELLEELQQQTLNNQQTTEENHHTHEVRFHFFIP